MFKNKPYELYEGDCLEVMDKLIEQGVKVDMILCDLPYGVTRNAWDSIIPLDLLWERYEKIIGDNGIIVLFGQGKFTAKLVLSNEKMWRYNLVWNKVLTCGFLNAKRMPLRNHEDICIFYKRLPMYNPQFTEGEPLHGMGKKFKNTLSENNNYGKFNSCKNPSANRTGDTKKYPKSILEFSRPSSSTMVHPTQKPVALLEYLIKTYTNEDMIVLDNCMGSGSAGVACLNTNCKFIGIELDDTYFDIAEDRISKAYEEKLGKGEGYGTK